MKPCGPPLVDQARPAGVGGDARPVSGSTTSGVSRAYKAISFASAVVIVLPRYSGVRPTISPPMKTPTSAIITMLYRPVPSPPNVTSPSSMFTSGTSTPSG